MSSAVSASDDKLAMSGRATITAKEPKPLVQNHRTFFDLPGELRNEIYSLAFTKDYQRVPLNSLYLNKPDTHIALLRACSQVYQEARSYIIEMQTVYIPVMEGMDWSYGEPATDYGLLRNTKDTIAAALTDCMKVHFHLHIDLLCKEDYNPEAVLASLTAALKIYMAHSWELYLKHQLSKRRATIHLDHLLSLWPKLFAHHNCLRVGTLQRLIELIAEDKMTDWDIRYYVTTGQSNAPLSYGNCHSPKGIRDAEVAQLRYYSHRHDNITVMAEVYGESTEWEYGDAVKCVTRHRTPATEFWPNVHFNVSRYKIEAYKDATEKYPEQMPVEFFDDEVLKAAHTKRAAR